MRDVAHHAREGLLFGLVIPNLGETEIFEPICQAIAASPDAEGHALLWAHSDSRSANQEEQALQLCRQCIARAVSGVFFAPLEMTEHSAEVNRRVMKLLKEAAIPVVLLDRRPDDSVSRERCDLVGITEHLLRLGALRIGFLAYRNQASTVKTRILGYTDALATLRGSESRPCVFHSPPEALECDAFVCSNDRVAGHLMHTLLARGIRIPEQIIHQPCRDIGETALRVMLERLDRPKMPARDILLDCALVVRQSCGAGGAAF